jgi:DNA-binding LytR/AlgR family response regulator
MNVIIVEDEDLSAEHLANLLIKIDKSIEVLGKFDTVKSVKEAFLEA